MEANIRCLEVNERCPYQGKCYMKLFKWLLDSAASPVLQLSCVILQLT